jgi:hypothetical protein
VYTVSKHSSSIRGTPVHALCHTQDALGAQGTMNATWYSALKAASRQYGNSELVAHAQVILPLLIFTFGPISGAHFNPMVTSVFVATKRMVGSSLMHLLNVSVPTNHLRLSDYFSEFRLASYSKQPCTTHASFTLPIMSGLRCQAMESIPALMHADAAPGACIHCSADCWRSGGGSHCLLKPARWPCHTILKHR